MMLMVLLRLISDCVAFMYTGKGMFALLGLQTASPVTIKILVSTAVSILKSVQHARINLPEYLIFFREVICRADFISFVLPD